MKENKIYYYVGDEKLSFKCLQVFDDEVCDFLSELSLSLMKDSKAKNYPDIITFAFWIRKANIHSKKQNYSSDCIRLGKGIAFHITPSNVPINFAFSLAFGLLSGNANIVRVSQKKFEQVDIVCGHIKEILKRDKYKIIKQNIAIISYEHNEEITNFYSSICDIRIIWGGDDTINEIRKSPISPRTTEITFANRYSFSIISAKSILETDEDKLKNLAYNFYNDTYLIDQNACSSPHLMVWFDDLEDKNSVSESKDRFWNAVFATSDKWDMQDIHASEKYTLSCIYAAKYDDIASLQKYDNFIYIMNLKSISDNVLNIRGKFGLFSQTDIKSYDDILPLLKKEVQSITYYGIDARELANFILKSGQKGIDRIVPFGKALELDLIWDGIDLINSMSRIIGVI